MEEGVDSEQISDHFTCAVCLDVLYKPVVLVCGHVSCFWCCQHSMHMRSESHCPLCRNGYHHFPAICLTLHFLLKKLYPVSYNRRKLQTLEDEKHSSLGFSPDIDRLMTSEELNHMNDEAQSLSVNNEDGSSVDPSSTDKSNLNEGSSGTCDQVSISDVVCVACTQLLYRPVVLNCGHVYCEACITIPIEGMLRCQVCECRHPSGLPKVCRELDYFLEERFFPEYALRRSTIQVNQQQTQNMISPDEASTQFPKDSFPAEENFLQSHGSKFHHGVGCDMCGMCPIIGERYQCKDCTEKSGYDLCGDCHNSGLNLPGRFNQKHTPSHRLLLVKPDINRNVIYRLLSGQLAVVSSIASRYQSSPANTSPDLPSSLDEDGVSSDTTEYQTDS
uniref:E3 ubiquitin-protein ligase PRT1-like n=1 Tax=Erigeron canadensis TaxID=72917 RepID=UPI001CB8D59C|nr:E3 ubiquitin-protein ligase PRT1-like [Erigeron canadensis]